MSWLELSAELDSRRLSVELSLEPGEVLAVIGPNGAGKSTLLEILAGLLPADSGRLVIDGKDLWRVPAHRRRIASLSQRAMLFPHLSVRDNVAFAPRSARLGRTRSREIAEEFLALVGVIDLAGRRVSQISGGQAQRVAIARALAAGPELLLLDEPLAALDVEVASEIRQILRRVLTGQRETAAIVVTHDLLDVLALADRVVVLAEGRIVESGGVQQVLSTPRSGFAARLAGVNLVRGRFGDGGLQVGEAAHALVMGEPTESPVIGDPAVALFRPNTVAIHLDPVAGSPRNCWPMQIRSLEAFAQGVRVRGHHAALGEVSADITAAAAAELGLEVGDECWFAVKATQVQILPAKS